MRMVIVILIFIFGLFSIDFSFCENEVTNEFPKNGITFTLPPRNRFEINDKKEDSILQPEELKKLKTRQENFAKTLTNGVVGRFQAIKQDAGIFILDTKEGHIWSWGMEGGNIYLVYGGQVYPGRTIGEAIETKVKIKIIDQTP